MKTAILAGFLVLFIASAIVYASRCVERMQDDSAKHHSMLNV